MARYPRQQLGLDFSWSGVTQITQYLTGERQTRTVSPLLPLFTFPICHEAPPKRGAFVRLCLRTAIRGDADHMFNLPRPPYLRNVFETIPRTDNPLRRGEQPHRGGMFSLRASNANRIRGILQFARPDRSLRQRIQDAR